MEFDTLVSQIGGLPLFHSSLVQTGWDGEIIDERNWRTVLHQYINAEKIQSARQDVEPFLERPEDLELITWNNISKLLALRIE